MAAALMFCGDGEPGYIGVQIKNEDGAVAITMVVADSPADKAGLKAEDVVLKMNGQHVTDVQSFVQKVRDTKPGDEIKLVVKRDGKEQEIKVKVGKKPDCNAA
jgi:S1-C subfamily serine protease